MTAVLPRERGRPYSHSWMVSFADLLGVLLCFFVLRYALGVPRQPPVAVPAPTIEPMADANYVITWLAVRLPPVAIVAPERRDGAVDIRLAHMPTVDELAVIASALRLTGHALAVITEGTDWVTNYRRSAGLAQALQHAGYDRAIVVGASNLGEGVHLRMTMAREVRS